MATPPPKRRLNSSFVRSLRAVSTDCGFGLHAALHRWLKMQNSEAGQYIDGALSIRGGCLRRHPKRSMLTPPGVL